MIPLAPGREEGVCDFRFERNAPCDGVAETSRLVRLPRLGERITKTSWRTYRVPLCHRHAAFASRDDLGEQIKAEIEGCDPGWTARVG
jgi:hypothetical protein